jgi:alpha-galactosidase
MKTTFIYLIALFILATTGNAAAQKNPELAKSPPMGWNSWNWYGKQKINEQIVRETIDAMAEKGLRDAGYIYVVFDGGWRDVKTGPNGELLPHPVKFPNGIKPLADYAHSKGLKLGLHTVPGTHDCGGDPVGGFNREEVHIQQFVDWGIDFVKVDLCKQEADPCETCEKSNTGWSEETIKKTYEKWGRLLNDSGRDIVFSISAYVDRDWYSEVCNMARTTWDIKGHVHGGAVFNSADENKKVSLSVMHIARVNNMAADAAGNGYWNDPDMMVTGEQGGLSLAEQESHFALWCIMSSPLILGNDPRIMTNAEKNIITNSEMIAVNQDPTEQGRLIKEEDNTQVWLKNLSNGDVAVLFINLDDKVKDVTLNLKEIGIKGKVSGRDLVNRKDLGKYKKSITQGLNTNHCKFILLSK